MTDVSSESASRRHFLASLVPACAATCLLGTAARAARPQDGGEGQQDAPLHKFDRPLDKELTVTQYYATRYGEVIRLGQGMTRCLGEDEALDVLRRATSSNLKEYGSRLAKQLGKDDFRTFTGLFRGPAFDGTLTREVVEDTDTAFELKVTECIWARVFRQAGAGEIGHACVCHGDHAMAEGFNPKIELQRDQTLMQGKAICNHRYVWKG